VQATGESGSFPANLWSAIPNLGYCVVNIDIALFFNPANLSRLDWVWAKVFEGSGKEYRLVAAPLEGWNPGRWWENDKSAQYVFTEIIKLAYYRVAH
jgi:hypothetical protein